MRSKMFAGIAYRDGIVPCAGDPLGIAEMFFCFLAGFSESFVPNILSKSADPKVGAGKTAGDKVAAANAAVGKAAADQVAADEAHDKPVEEK
jgi:hypothetical protein